MKFKFVLLDVKINKIFIVYPLLFFTYVALLPHTGHGWDLLCWEEWTKHVFIHGVGGAYKTYKLPTDYPPLFHYLLYLFGLFQGSLENIKENFYYFKTVPLIFDFIGGLFLTRLIQDKYKDDYKAICFSLLLFLNIAYLYNTIIWGQLDGIMTAFIFAAFFYAIKEKILLTIVFTLLALNFKLQSIIFIPLLGLVLLPAFIEKFSTRKLIIWLLVPTVLQLLILLPFILSSDLNRVWNVVIDSFSKFPVVSMNAYNMWSWLISGDLTIMPDSTLFCGISYKHWGLFLFFMLSFVALLPICINTYLNVIKKKETKIAAHQVLLVAALLPLIFFFFNTEMHERYSHPSILLIGGYSILTKRFLPYILISCANLLNLEAVLKYLQLKDYSILLFNPCLVAGLFFITILLLYWDLFKSFRSGNTDNSTV